MDDELPALSTSHVVVNNKKTKANRSRGLFTILFGLALLVTIGYNTFQWRTLDFYPLLSPSTIDSTGKIPKTTQNQSAASSEDYFSRYRHGNTFISYSSSAAFTYSESVFRSSSTPPTLWVDVHGDIRWNEAAEREVFIYLSNKQILKVDLSEDEMITECLRRQFFMIEQHSWGGFFSRQHCLIEQFGQTLYSPWTTLLSYRRFYLAGSGRDDFQDEGILRYFEPISTCDKYSRHTRMKTIELQLRGVGNNSYPITDIHQLLYQNQLRNNTKFSVLEVGRAWAFGYEHVPLRRWMFGYNRFAPTYNLSVKVLINHTAEHIYRAPSLNNSFLSSWIPRNRPFSQPQYHLPGDQYKLTWEDEVFTGFLRYMFALYFHRLAPRIHQMTRLLAEHWSSYLMDKGGGSLNDMAALYIRRGDKLYEDSFWKKHKRWRNISMYVKGIVDEERRRNRTFSSVFVMTDDLSVMKSIEDYADLQSNGTDEPYAREQLRHRQILYNIFAPQACLDPYMRVGFDQLMVSTQFIVQYAQFTVTHSDSNVARYMEEITYAWQQLKPFVHSYSFVKDAPDSM